MTHFEISIIVEADDKEKALQWLKKYGDFDISDIEVVEN
jgi:hypothetical protein